MTAYPGQTLTRAPLGQLCTSLWDSQSRPVVIQPGIDPGPVVTPLALRCSALDCCTTREPIHSIFPIFPISCKVRSLLSSPWQQNHWCWSSTWHTHAASGYCSQGDTHTLVFQVLSVPGLKKEGRSEERIVGKEVERDGQMVVNSNGGRCLCFNLAPVCFIKGYPPSLLSSLPPFLHSSLPLPV